MEITYLKHDEIDKTKYNSCVHFSPNGNIFGYKWYLDNIAKEWDVLIENDYESVMPLPFSKDGFLKNNVLYQPGLIRELGLFSINVLSHKRVRSFLDKIPSHFKKVSINLNERIVPTENLGFDTKTFQNHQLLLDEKYETLANNFSREILLKLEKAEQVRLRPNNQIKPEVVAAFYKKHHPNKKNLEQNFHALQRIMWNALHRGWGFASAVYSFEKELLAVNFFLFSHNKIISLMPAVSKEGKEKGALEYLFNMVLKTNAGKPSVLDFNTYERNDLAIGFGAKTNNFYQINRDKRLFGIL